MRRAGSGHLALMLAATSVVFLIGAVQKAPCANSAWVEQHEGVSIQCYSDVGTLLLNEQLAGGRRPYVDPCRPSPITCDEYPPVTMYAMWATAALPGAGDPYARFYWANTVVLFICALIVTLSLERMGAQTILFAAAPTLAIYGTMNWDLIAVALASLGTLAFIRRRDSLSGVLLGIGAAAKIYPAFLLIPFVAHRLHEGDRRGAARLAVTTAFTWLAINLPLAIAAPDGWLTFFKTNAERPADHGTLWRALCEAGVCASSQIENILGLVVAAVATGWLWRRFARHDPEFPRWIMAFPFLVFLFITSKVSSSQYILWILPWFALVATAVKPYLFEQATEILVYGVTFSFFAGIEGGSGPPYWVVAISLILRAAALLVCVFVWAGSVERGALFIPSARPPDVLDGLETSAG